MKILNIKNIIIMFVLLFLVIFSFILNTPISSLDELWNYSFSKNVADGLVPYKDFNLVQTPLLFFFTSLFLKFIFNGLLMTRILGALLAVAILVMVYLILNKLVKHKYINIFMLLNICLITIPLFNLDYNFTVLLFALIILNYELKGGEEELLKLNIKKDFLVGIIAGLAIITKQSTGLMIAVAYVLYKWLAIRKKEEFLLAFKISLSRGLGVLVPIVIFFSYLFMTNSFMDFMNFCVFGVSEFSNSIPYSDLILFGNYDVAITILAIMVPLVIAYTLIYFIKNFKLNTLENKNILKLFVFGLASFIVTFPISDDIHFLIGSIIFIILSVYIVSTHIEIDEKIRRILTKIIVFLSCIISATLLVLMCLNYYKYFTNNDKNNDIYHYNYVPMDQNLGKRIKFINEYIEQEKLQNNNVYIVNGDAVLYNIPADRYNKYFDLLLKGNLGKNGVQNVIDKINELEENSIFLILQTDKYNLNWQVPKEVIDHIKSNYNLTGKIAIFDIYSKK